MKFFLKMQNLREELFPARTSQFEHNFLDPKRPFILFISSILLYLLYLLVMQPGWMTSGAMCAEMATNYYPNANASSYVQKLFSTDAGYIPAPQRIIALIGTLLKIPASSIPYFYTYTSILCSGMLVGSFCLAPFRKIIESDFLRFFTSLAALLIVDFETRTFINFTYFAAFFVAIVTALALVDDVDEVPWWAGFIPILMVSKPAVLAALPAMILTAFVSRSRFRWIVVFALLLCLGQLSQLLISSTTGVMPFRSAYFSFSSKMLAISVYFLTILGGYVAGHSSHHLHLLYLMLFGAFSLFLCAGLIYFKRSSSNALILTGISLLFFNVFLVTFALSDFWNINEAILHNVPIERHIIVGFLGCSLILCGIISSLSNHIVLAFRVPFSKEIGAFIFIVWFLGVGWFNYAGRLNKDPDPSILHGSQWQIMASAIDADPTHLCVPIVPWTKNANWMYHKNCGLLGYPSAWEDGNVLVKANFPYQIPIPQILLNNTLVSAAVLVKPLGVGRYFVDARMRLKLKDGSIRYFLGSNGFDESGGLLMLLGKAPISMNEVEEVTLIFNLPVQAARTPQEHADTPSVTWMGY